MLDEPFLEDRSLRSRKILFSVGGLTRLLPTILMGNFSIFLELLAFFVKSLR